MILLTCVNVMTDLLSLDLNAKVWRFKKKLYIRNTRKHLYASCTKPLTWIVKISTKKCLTDSNITFIHVRTCIYVFTYKYKLRTFTYTYVHTNYSQFHSLCIRKNVCLVKTLYISSTGIYNYIYMYMYMYMYIHVQSIYIHSCHFHRHRWVWREHCLYWTIQ